MWKPRTSNDGNPFDLKNKLVLIQLKNKEKSIYFTKEDFHFACTILRKSFSSSRTKH
jgi:hypothetical protein